MEFEKEKCPERQISIFQEVKLATKVKLLQIFSLFVEQL